MEETMIPPLVCVNKRCQELRKSLAAMRTAEKSDVTLTCADKEFFGHKSVLEASSPYFVAMFHCGLEEAKSGKVFFQDMDPEALELILDYLYLGTVDKIQTTCQLKKVLESSHLMQLEQLVSYCFDALAEQLSLENFVDICNAADKFGSKEMSTKVFNFLKVAVEEVLYSPLFTCLTFEQLKTFLSLTYEMGHFCDKFLVGIIVWLRKDLPERAKYAKELFECTDAKFLSKTTVKKLLEDKELMSSCEEIRNGLNEIGVAVAYFNPMSSSVATELENLISTKLGQVRIVFHSEYQYYFEPNLNSINIKLINHLQEFNPCIMSWQRAFIIYSSAHNSTISGQNYIAMQDDVLRTITCSYTLNSTVLKLDTNAEKNSIVSFWYLNRTDHGWDEIRKPNCVMSSRIVVASSNYIYIVGTSEKSGELVIKFNVLQYLTKLDWNVLPPPHIPYKTKTHFFVYKDKLCGFYYAKGESVRIMFDHEQGKWFAKVLPIGPPRITGVSCIYRGSPDQCIVFVSTVDAVPQIPNFIWDPESGKWTRLPLPKGKCELEQMDKLYKLWRVYQ